MSRIIGFAVTIAGGPEEPAWTDMQGQELRGEQDRCKLQPMHPRAEWAQRGIFRDYTRQ